MSGLDKISTATLSRIYRNNKGILVGFLFCVDGINFNKRIDGPVGVHRLRAFEVSEFCKNWDFLNFIFISREQFFLYQNAFLNICEFILRKSK